MTISQIRQILTLAFVLAAAALVKTFHHAAFRTIAMVTFVYLSALMLTLAIMLDYPGLPRQPRPNDIAEALEGRNLLVSTHFCAERAFCVAELHHEGPHYFLELEDGGILHLSGPYLRNYEPGEGVVRYFPCTRFAVRRHAQLGRAVDLLCDGVVIEPEAEAPPYTPSGFALGLVPADGEILRYITFDQLVQQRMHVRNPVPLRAPLALLSAEAAFAGDACSEGSLSDRCDRDDGSG